MAVFLPPSLLGVAGILDGDGGEPAEGDEELKILVGEGILRRQAVDVEHAYGLLG